MSNNHPSNLIIIEDPSPKAIARIIKKNSSSQIFTNGIYALGQQMVVPTVLSAFRFTADQTPDKNSTLVIAVNSDVSYRGIMVKRGDSEEKMKTEEDAYTRAIKVVEPLALLNPNQLVVATFYDEETPNEFYAGLKNHGLRDKALFKWGYGTNPNAPAIEGIESVEQCFGFPFPNDAKAICHDMTRKEDQTGKVFVHDLREPSGFQNIRYITRENLSCFPVRNLHPSLERFFTKEALTP